MHLTFALSTTLLASASLVSATGSCTNVCSSKDQSPSCIPLHMGVNDSPTTDAGVQCFPNGAATIGKDDDSYVLAAGLMGHTLGIKTVDKVDYLLVSKAGNYYKNTLSDGKTAALTIQNNYGCDTWVSVGTVVWYFHTVNYGCDKKGLHSGGYLDTADKKFRFVLQAL